MKYNTQTPYIAAYLIVKNADDKIAFVLRKNTAWLNGYYSLPAGKVEKEESYTQAAIREGKEEIGITVRPEDLVQKITVHRFSNDDGNNKMEWVDMLFEVVRYEGTVHNAEPDMHEEVAWFSIEELPDKLTPPVKDALEAIHEGKTYIEHGWK